MKEKISHDKDRSILDTILEKMKSVDFKKFPDPNKLSSQPMDVGLWALWFLQDHFGLDDNHFTANEISQVLLKQKISCSEDKITKGFTRAGEKIHRERNGKILSYMIMQPGIEYLTRLANNHSQDQYFAEFDGGGIHTFFLLQVDLANHTKWFAGKKVEKNNAKKELAMLVTDELRDKYEFHRLFWAGDGGVFVRTSEATPNYDVVVDAGDTIYELFGRWKKKYNTLETNLLDIRVSGHISPIFADKDPGFWTSEELNNFIKYERSISEEGFSITKQIRDLLTAQKQERFDSPVKEIKNKDGVVVMQVFLDSKHRLKN